MDKDYYKIIGLTHEAGAEEIKKAYQVLGNEEKRRLYDFFLQRSPGPEGARIHDLDEMFAFRNPFGMRRGGCRGRGMGMGCRRWK